MRRFVSIALLVAATPLTAALGGSPSAPKADGRLEGTWVIESVRKDGQPDPTQAGGTVTFAGHSVTFQPPAVVGKARPAAAQSGPAPLS